MARSPTIRRQKSPWRGFFCAAPTPALPADDSEVHSRVKHLRHLQALREAMELRDDTEVSGVSAARDVDDDLFGGGDGLFGDDGHLQPTSRLTDPRGGDLRVGQTIDELREKYSQENVGLSGRYGDGPGDPRTSWRSGMAKEEGAHDNQQAATEEAYADWMTELEQARTFRKGYEALIDEVLDLHLQWTDLSKLQIQTEGVGPWMYEVAVAQMVESLRTKMESHQKLAEQVGKLAEEAAKSADEKAAYYQGLRSRRIRVEKPHPDEGAAPPTPPLGSRFWDQFRALQTWGNPATDFKLGRNDRGRVMPGLLDELFRYEQGERPAIYDRLGNLQKHRQIHLTAEDIKRIARFGNPSINWGPDGPPIPHPRRLGSGWVGGHSSARPDGETD